MSDQHDRQPDDRMGLEAFDAVDAPDQWDDIIRRSAGAELGTTASAAPTGRRRSPATWFMAAAAVALVAVAAVAISVRSGGDESPAPATTPDDTMPTPDSAPTTVPTTEPPATTTEPTTIPTTEPPATTAPPASTVPVVPSDVVVTAWNPDCTERAGSGRVSGSIDPALAGFTTVDTAPTLDIVLPTIDTANGEYQPLVSTAVVPDGVAVGLFEYSADNESVITIEVVDLDGDIRWRRCLAGIGWPRAMIPAGQQLWLAAGDGEALLVPFDLATGAEVLPPFGTGDRTIDGALDDRLLVGVPWDAGAIGPDDRLGIIDLGTVNVTDIPYPDVALGRSSDMVRYELVAGPSGLLIAGTPFDSNRPEVVWTGDTWSSDPDELRALPPTIRIPYGDDAALELLDGAGDVVWSEPGFHHISREGFASAMADSVVLVMECLTWTDGMGCQWLDENTPPDEQLVAFDLETGTRLWTRPGGQAFAAIDGDRGIVTADTGWELIDLRTGDRVDDVAVTAWPQDDIFFNECCGAGDYIWTRLHGGVLFEATGDRLRVWLPPEVSTPTVTVTAFE